MAANWLIVDVGHGVPSARRNRRPARRPVLEQLEGRLLLTGSVDITLDKAFDRFGFQAETVQVYEDKASWGAIFDTGASLVSFSAADQLLMDPFGTGAGIPIKVPGGAQAEGIGGMLTGDVSQPGTVLVDGIQTSVLTADIFGEGNGLFLDQIQGQGTVVSAAGVDHLVGNDRLNLEDGIYVGYRLVFTSTAPDSSSNLGQSRTITAYDGDTRAFILSSGFPQTPVPGDAFHIVVDQAVTAGPLPARDQFTGTPVAGDLDGLSDSNDAYVGRYVLFTSGPLDGHSQLITGYDGATHAFQLALPFSQRPQAGDTFDVVVGTGSSAVMPGVQVFVGTPTGSELLSTISGTPMLNPTAPVPIGGEVPNPVAGPQPLHPNGLAVDVNPQGVLLDLGDLLGDLFPDGLFDGITLPIPSVQFREPGTALERSESFHAESAVALTPSPTAQQFAGGSELPDDPENPELFHDFYVGFQLRFLSGSLNGETREVSAYDSATRTFTCTTPFSQPPAVGDLFELVRISTDPITLGLDFVEFDNHLDPGDIMTVSYNPVSAQVRIGEGLATLDNQCFLFDTGAQLSTISVAQARALGLDLSAPEFTTSVQGAGGTVAGLPGYTLDELSIPTLEGGRLTFHDAPVFVLDITEQIQGILGMNLFNNAAEFLYDPYDRVHGQPTLQTTFFEQRAEVAVPIDTTGLEPLEAALLQSLADVMPVAFGTAVGLRDISLPGFGVGVDLDLTPQGGVVTQENGTTVVTVPPGTALDFTAEVRYSAEPYDSFRLDFAASDSALHLRDWTTGANWTGTDAALAFPGDSDVGGHGSAQWSSTLGTFVVDAPAAPGDYVLTADDALDNTAFLTGATDPLAIRDFGQIIIRVQDTPALAIADATLVEGDNGTVANLEFTVTLTGVASGMVSVDYGTADGSAQTANGDYASRSGTLQFAPGETQKTVTVPVFGDSAPETDEDFFVRLSQAAIATGPHVLTPVSDATGVDTNGDFNFDYLETNPAEIVQLTADGDPLASPLHAFALEFDLSAIPAGATVTAAALTFVETVNTGSAIDVHGYAGDPDGTVTLANPFNIPLDNKLGSMGMTPGAGTESLDVTAFVQQMQANHNDFAGFYAQSGDIFGTGQYAIHSGDATDPANRPKLIVEFSAGPAVVEIADGQGRAVIRNDDTELSISNREQTEGDEGQTAAAFVIQLSQPSALEVAVSYATADGAASAGSDYESAQGTVAFAPRETAKAISIPILGDRQVEPDETFFVNLTDPWHATIATGHEQGTGTITDNDTPALTVDVAVASVAETAGAGATTVTIRRNTPTDSELAVTLTSSDTSEATVPEQVTIPAGAQSVEFALTAVDDHVVDGTQTVTITASAAGFSPGTATVDVTEEDGDHDGVSTAVEGGAPDGGDGNHDGVPDNQQGNVTSFPNAVDAGYVTLAAPDGVALEDVSTTSTAPAGDVPPTTTFPIGFLEYTVTDASVGFATTVVIFWESSVTLNSYLKYGPTPDDAAPHWYPFMYDGTTGAKIYSDRIEVHLVDGLRGDADLTANGRIVDPGAPSASEHPWQNPVLRVNVNNDSIVSPLDVLLVINEINMRNSRTLPPAPANGESLPPFWDVSGDDKISPQDVLLVINYLNSVGASRQRMAVGQEAAIRPTGVGEGESASSLREPLGRAPLDDPFLVTDTMWQAPGISTQPVGRDPGLMVVRSGDTALVVALPPTVDGDRSILEQRKRAESVTDDLFAQLDSAPLERVLSLPGDANADEGV
jgi:hypothetical protein